MLPEEAFLRAILADPDDDAPRLIYADWLDERGDAARAEFIRVQCAVAALKADDPRRPALEARELDLVTAHGPAWAAPLRGLVKEWDFARGFVERVTCDGTTFLDRADELFRMAPVRRLKFRWHPDLQQLARCPYLARLQALDLSYEAVGDAVQHLTHCPHLKLLAVLDLTGAGLRRAGARSLVNSPYLTSLEELILRENPRVPEAERQALRRRFGQGVRL